MNRSRRGFLGALALAGAARSAAPEGWQEGRQYETGEVKAAFWRHRHLQPYPLIGVRIDGLQEEGRRWVVAIGQESSVQLAIGIREANGFMAAWFAPQNIDAPVEWIWIGELGKDWLVRPDQQPQRER